MRAVFLSLLILVAGPVRAAPSLCAHLPEAGKVAAAAADVSVPPRPRPDRSLACPPGHALDMVARPPVCRRPGLAVADGNPRAACRARLALGPVAQVPAQYRPTRSCPSGPISALLRLEGANVGLADVTLAAGSPGFTLTSIDDHDADLAPEETPAGQGCFAHECRLVRMVVAADAGDEAWLDLAIADGEKLTVKVPLTAHCEDPAARPVQATRRDTNRRVIANPNR